MLLRARCIHLNWQAVLIILLALICKEVQHSETGNLASFQNNDVNKTESVFIQNSKCQQQGIKCSDLIYPCIECSFKNVSCKYGAETNVTCRTVGDIKCDGDREFNKTMKCRYCYQTDTTEHSCVMKANCRSISTPREYYQTNCSVNEDVICLGKRKFPKRVLCNWTSGYKWSTTLILSITLGGFGADRFYLGHWQEGIGKLFSFGGLGVWTLIDVLLIALHYLGPADGSLYI